jgi:3-deoxy-manno-octulosonate cytidylyltransferase (CMP-KDO synthetase)
MVDFAVVIPARYASTRLPGKPLIDIGGRPMVVHVAERARRSGASEVVIATDHPAIAEAARGYGHQVCMTRAEHASGTERIAEVIEQRSIADSTIIVNVQGDEPLIEPGLIAQVAQQLAARDDAVMATACCPITDAAVFANPNVVKVVLDAAGYALYFSRAAIPYPRDAFAHGAAQLPPSFCPNRHIGIYAYRARFLRSYARLAPAPLEQWEALEQLRVLWHGLRISVLMTADTPHGGVDTQDDLDRVRRLVDAT